MVWRDYAVMVVRFRFRLYLLSLLTMAGFAGLLVRLWSIQVDRNDYYRSLVPGTSELTVRVPGVRGEIKDRDGEVLATNKSNYEVIFNLKEIYAAYRKQHQNIPKYKYLGRVRGMPKEVEEVDIFKIVNDSVISRLEELGLARPVSADRLRVHYRTNSGVVPYTYRRDLSFEEFARFAEHNLDLAGVSVAARPVRHYLYDSLASHLLGYVRLPDVQQVPAEVRQQFNFYVGDDFGISGIEKSMDQYLQGKPGRRIILRNEKGRIVGETSFEPPVAGADVHLTINAHIQYVAEEALRQIGRGAAVVIDPSDGAILAMASVPSFDPNKFIPAIAANDWKEYIGNPTNPLTNRAIQSFAPGSTYKIPIAFAGILAGTNRQHFQCTGGVPFGNRVMHCWIHEKGGAHGWLGLDEAIKRSCNAFFYQYGNEAGISNIQAVGKLFSLGEKYDLPLAGVSPGILPGPRWLMMNQPGHRWTSALTALVSIGQGATEASPLQMAMVVAAVANGGKCYQPRLVDQVVEKNGEIVFHSEPVMRHDLTREGFSKRDIELVRQGMWKVVNELGGTAGRARSKKTVISGKTGTAQAYLPDRTKDNTAWFLGFAPYDEPKLAVCVMVQNGKSGGGVGAPIAKKIIEETLAVEHGYEIPLQEITEAGGNFEYYEYVTFDPNEQVESTFEDADTGAQVADFMPVALKPKERAPQVIPAAPSIEPEADAEGSMIPKARKFFNPWKKRDSDPDEPNSSETSPRKKRGFPLFRR